MKKYNCPNCAAELFWNAELGSLHCEYCERDFIPEDLDKSFSVESTAEPKEEKITREVDPYDKATDDSTSADLVVYSCTNCGADVITARSTVATTCAFCGRAISLSDKLVGNFKPERIIPFLQDEEKAIQIYKNYCKKAVLSPKQFKKNNEIKKVKGLYVPFWLHSFDEEADVLIGAENVFSHKRGDDKVIEHHRYQIPMHVSGKFTSIPTDGLSNLDNNLMSAIEPFDYSKLTDFNPAYMAGFYAEEYDEDAETTRNAALSRADEAMKNNATQNAGLYEVKVCESFTSSYSNETSAYAMLPVWMFNVEYKNKNYQFAVNGETGKIAGKLPTSVGKLIGAALGSGILTQAICLVIRLLTYGG